MAPNKREAIVWNNDGKFADVCVRHSASMSWKISVWFPVIRDNLFPYNTYKLILDAR